MLKVITMHDKHRTTTFATENYKLAVAKFKAEVANFRLARLMGDVGAQCVDFRDEHDKTIHFVVWDVKTQDVKGSESLREVS